jgi:hypothetical protein
LLLLLLQHHQLLLLLLLCQLLKQSDAGQWIKHPHSLAHTAPDTTIW